MPVIELQELTKSYGSVQALKGLSLSVPQGSLFGLLGPNGSGKTTLLKSIAGFLPLNSGKIILKTPITENSPKNKYSFLISFQQWL